MTVMGMAASQARFLGLTARKSNVEYQGQQINQQRTALANESANLYNQMMDLTVPTPPSTTDFYKNAYVLDNSAANANSDYQIGTMTKIIGTSNTYNVSLITNVTEVAAMNATSKITSGSKNADVYNFVAASVGILSYEKAQEAAYANGNTLEISQNQIYKVQLVNGQPTPYIEGYEDCAKELKDAQGNIPTMYFYQDVNGKNHYLTESDLKKMTDYIDGTSTEEPEVVFAHTYNITKPVSTEVKATVEETENGRYTTITIAQDSAYPSNLSGKTFSISTKNEYDEEAYNDAFNEYEYQKAQYEKSVADINAKTELIQQQDQQLELRLQQLNTEQNAIKTEMDAVKGIIKDNVEKTFNIFS